MSNPVRRMFNFFTPQLTFTHIAKTILFLYNLIIILTHIKPKKWTGFLWLRTEEVICMGAKTRKRAFGRPRWKWVTLKCIFGNIARLCWLDSSSSGMGTVARSCEYGRVISRFTKGLSDSHLYGLNVQHMKHPTFRQLGFSFTKNCMCNQFSSVSLFQITFIMRLITSLRRNAKHWLLGSRFASSVLYCDMTAESWDSGAGADVHCWATDRKSGSR
jgi:hypothetical protein